jgi:mycothiol synthase
LPEHAAGLAAVTDVCHVVGGVVLENGFVRYPGLRLETVRRLTPDLQQAVDALLDAAQAQDGVRAFGEHKWLRLIRGDDRFVALLLRDDDDLVAAAHCKIYGGTGDGCHVTAEMVVHPAHRDRGLGRHLLAGIVELEECSSAERLQLWAYGNLPQARHLAERFGFEPERLLLQYALDRVHLPEPPRRRHDVRIRTFDAALDAQVWLALHRRAFTAHPEQSAWDTNDLQVRLGQPWFDPRDFLVLEDVTTNDMIGFCWVKIPRDEDQPGEIYIVAVDPSVAGRGLGRFATEAGLAHIRARGCPGAMLYVEADNVAARALYERLGFVKQYEHVCYARRSTNNPLLMSPASSRSP